MMTKTAPREGYAQALLELGEKNNNVFVLDADCAKSNFTDRFRDAYPDKFLNIGISECDLVGTAAGLASMGKIPFANAYANFLTGRAYDQVRVSVAYSERNVKIVGHNAGTSAAQEGATHLPLEDVGLMRAIPDVTVVVPADSTEAKKATLAAAAHPGAVYLRIGKLPVPDVTTEQTPFEIGKACVMREGTDITLLNTGCLLYEVLEAAKILAEEGISAEVINVPTVKPLDDETIVKSAQKTGHVVTVEEHSIINGLGSAVAELLAENCPVPMRRIGTRDVFGLSGTMDELLDYFGLRHGDISATARELLGR